VILGTIILNWSCAVEAMKLANNGLIRFNISAITSPLNSSQTFLLSRFNEEESTFKLILLFTALAWTYHDNPILLIPIFT